MPPTLLMTGYTLADLGRDTRGRAWGAGDEPVRRGRSSRRRGWCLGAVSDVATRLVLFQVIHNCGGPGASISAAPAPKS
jgi:hypothetical protein